VHALDYLVSRLSAEDQKVFYKQRNQSLDNLQRVVAELQQLWPELADLDWAGAGLAIEPRPTTGDDKLGITGAFCAIAETGTLVLLSGALTPTATMLLPDTHVAVVSAARIVAGMEEAFALVRDERDGLPRAVNLVSGPSRTGDIEQTIVLGAHGPYRVHIMVVDH